VNVSAGSAVTCKKPVAGLKEIPVDIYSIIMKSLKKMSKRDFMIVFFEVKNPLSSSIRPCLNIPNQWVSTSTLRAIYGASIEERLPCSGA